MSYSLVLSRQFLLCPSPVGGLAASDPNVDPTPPVGRDPVVLGRFQEIAWWRDEIPPTRHNDADDLRRLALQGRFSEAMARVDARLADRKLSRAMSSAWTLLGARVLLARHVAGRNTPVGGDRSAALRDILGRMRRAASVRGQADALAETALDHLFSNEAAQGRKQARAARALYQTVGDDAGLADVALYIAVADAMETPNETTLGALRRFAPTEKSESIKQTASGSRRDLALAFLVTILRKAGRHADAIVAARELVARYRATNQSWREAVAIGALGLLSLLQEDPKAALPLLEQSVERLTRHLPSSGKDLADCYFALANAHRLLGEFQKCLDSARRALPYIAKVDPTTRSGLHFHLGYASAKLGDKNAALRWLDEYAVDIVAETDDEARRRSLFNLMLVYDELKETPRAIRALKDVLALAERKGDLEAQALAHALLAERHAAMGDTPQALEDNQKAIDAYEKIGDPGGERTGSLLIARSLLLGGEKRGDEAIETIRRAMEMLEKSASPARRLGARETLLILLLRANRFDEARVECRALISRARELRGRGNEARSLIQMGAICQALEKPEEARLAFQDAIVRLRAIGSPHDSACALAQWALLRARNRYETVTVASPFLSFTLKFFARQAQKGPSESGVAMDSDEILGRLTNSLILQERPAEAWEALDFLSEAGFFRHFPEIPGRRTRTATLELTVRETEASRLFESIDRELAPLIAEEATLFADDKAVAGTPLADELDRKIVAGLADFDRRLLALETTFPPTRVATQIRDSPSISALRAILARRQARTKRTTVLARLMTDGTRILVLLLDAAGSAPVARSKTLSPSEAGRDFDLPTLIGKDLDAMGARDILWDCRGGIANFLPDETDVPGRRHARYGAFAPPRPDKTAAQKPSAEKPPARRRALYASSTAPAKHPKTGRPWPESVSARAERAAIVRTFPDSVALTDAGFTPAGLEVALTRTPGAFDIVHIAAPVVLDGAPGEMADRSGIALGDGGVLDFARFDALPDNLFAGVEWLVFSVCVADESAMEASGGFLEAVAAIAKSKGARRVLFDWNDPKNPRRRVFWDAFYEILGAEPDADSLDVFHRARQAAKRRSETDPPGAIGQRLLFDNAF